MFVAFFLFAGELTSWDDLSCDSNVFASSSALSSSATTSNATSDGVIFLSSSSSTGVADAATSYEHRTDAAKR
jgi:hypothetical protein